MLDMPTCGKLLKNAKTAEANKMHNLTLKFAKNRTCAHAVFQKTNQTDAGESLLHKKVKFDRLRGKRACPTEDTFHIQHPTRGAASPSPSPFAAANKRPGEQQMRPHPLTQPTQATRSLRNTNAELQTPAPAPRAFRSREGSARADDASHRYVRRLRACGAQGPSPVRRCAQDRHCRGRWHLRWLPHGPPPTSPPDPALSQTSARPSFGSCTPHPLQHGRSRLPRASLSLPPPRASGPRA